MAKLGDKGDINERIVTSYDGSGIDEAKKDLESVSASSVKLTREFGKLGDVNEYAAAGLRRMGNVLQNMAFGAVIGAVSALTEELIKQYKESTITKEKIDELNSSVMEQAKAWKLLPEPIGNVTKATLDLFNAQLLYYQHLERSKGKELERQIELMEKAKKMRQEAMGKVVGPLAASIRGTWETEILEADVMLAGLHKDLEEWNMLMGQKTVTASTVNAALTGDATRKAYEAVEQKITAVRMAIAGLSVDKTDLLTIEAQELVSLGATTRQLQDYLDLREEQIHLNEMAVIGKTELPDVPDYSASTKAYEDRQKWQEDFDKKIFQQKVEAMGRLAELEANGPLSALKDAAANSEVARIYFEYDQKILALQDYNTRKLGLMVEAGATEAEIEATYRQMNIEAADKEKVFKIQAAGQAFGAASNMMQNLFVATGKHNKTMFALGKGFAIAQTAIDTYQASMAAYKALSGIPYVGPALGAAAAATIIATGLARVKEISSMQPGGGSISSGGTASPSYSGGSYTAYPVPERIEPVSTGREIKIIVYGSLVDHAGLVRELAPYIDEAKGDKVSFGS